MQNKVRKRNKNISTTDKTQKPTAVSEVDHLFLPTLNLDPGVK